MARDFDLIFLSLTTYCPAVNAGALLASEGNSMDRNRKKPSHSNDVPIADRFEAAKDYATGLLTGFKETAEPVPVAALLDSLTDEYWKAKRSRQGMDPDHVRIMVQGLLDSADFPADNRPEEYSPSEEVHKPVSEFWIPSQIFQFQRSVGAKTRSEHEIAALSFAVGAVMTRFELTLYRNAQSKCVTKNECNFSACDAVAAANARIGKAPNTYDALRKVIGKANHKVYDENGRKQRSSNPALEEGKLRGRLDKLTR